VTRLWRDRNGDPWAEHPEKPGKLVKTDNYALVRVAEKLGSDGRDDVERQLGPLEELMTAGELRRDGVHDEPPLVTAAGRVLADNDVQPPADGAGCGCEISTQQVADGIYKTRIGRVLTGAELQPGDPIPLELANGLTGLVAGECGHRMPGVQWGAGWRKCEACGQSA
jgi:hypothetical protein